MSYKFFTSSQKAWQGMYEAMQSARKSIYLEMYIFQDDMEQFNFLELLREKSQAGIKVKILLDSFGSSSLSTESLEKLRSSKVEVLFLSHFLHRMHRKILVVDGTLAFVGGVNMHQSAFAWKDLVMKIKGPFTASVLRSFIRAYMQAGGTDSDVLGQYRKGKKTKSKDWIVEHFPVLGNSSLRKIYEKHLRLATESIVLVTPYFMPKRWLIATLDQAALRGVDVSILVPKRTDHFFTDRVNYFYMAKLSKLGIKFYMEEKMNHAKAMIIDGTMAIVGSNNMDFISFDLNSEAGVFLQDKDALAKLKNIASNWKEGSTMFDPQSYRASWFDYGISPLLRLFAWAI